jgi:hypothetical protein
MVLCECGFGSTSVLLIHLRALVYSSRTTGIPVERLSGFAIGASNAWQQFVILTVTCVGLAGCAARPMGFTKFSGMIVSVRAITLPTTRGVGATAAIHRPEANVERVER